MVKPYDDDQEWESRKADIIGLGERSLRKNYYPQLKQNVERLERFHTLLDHTSDLVMLINLPEGSIVDTNAAFGALMGMSVDALLEKKLTDLGFQTEAQKLMALLHQDMMTLQKTAIFPTHSVIIQFQFLAKRPWVELTFQLAKLEHQYYGVIVGRDVTERKKHEETMAALLAEKAALLDNALVGIVSVKDRRIVSCNRRFEEMLGYPPGSTVGKSKRILYESDELFTTFGNDAYSNLNHGSKFSATVQLVRADRSKFWCEITGQPLDSKCPQNGSIWILTDVHDRKLAEDKAVFLSHHDNLTELPNHQLLKDRLNQAMMLAQEQHKYVGLLVIDIDRFKSINDSLGYGIGNQLLIELSKRISQVIRDVDTLSRQGGDEFTLLLPNMSIPEYSVSIISDIMALLHQPIHIYEQEILLTASFGISIFPNDGNDFETLMKKAEMAMYQAKASGRNCYQFFNDAMNVGSTEPLMLSIGLRKALEQNQLQLYYQPQLEISSGQLIGAEALLRWKHPELGMIPPGKFIPVAEETGLIIPIGEWVLHEACHEVLKWKNAGLDNPVVAVNLSALQFSQGDIESVVLNAIQQAGIQPEMLELELTESIMIRDPEKVLSIVQRLKAMGVKLSIDDFGTGYSSLSYLKRFSVDKLKIDQAFIRELVNNQDDAAIVKAIIQMAYSLGLKTIAEGVETAQTLELLNFYSCDEVQGYYLGKPMPSEDFLAFIHTHLSNYEV